MAEATTGHIANVNESAILAGRPALGTAVLAFYVTVVVVQGGHVVEHIIQLIQVFALGVPENDALGLGQFEGVKGLHASVYREFHAVTSRQDGVQARGRASRLHSVAIHGQMAGSGSGD